VILLLEYEISSIICDLTTICYKYNSERFQLACKYFVIKQIVSMRECIRSFNLHLRKIGKLLRGASNFRKADGFNANDDINTRHREHCRHAESCPWKRGRREGDGKGPGDGEARARWWTGGSSSERWRRSPGRGVVSRIDVCAPAFSTLSYPPASTYPPSASGRPWG